MVGNASDSDDTDLGEVGAALRRKLTEVTMRIDDLTAPPEANIGLGFGKRVGDGTTEAISRFTNVGTANDLAAIRKRIERAIEKLGEGTYGCCDICGEAIATGRLRVAPESALCIEHARATR